MSSRIVFIGAADAEAGAFEAKARRDFPNLDLFASNDRTDALHEAHSADAFIGHHFQFDEELLRKAPKLRWIQSLTTGTDAILKLKALKSEVVVTSTRGMHGPQMSELVFLQMLALLRDFPRMQHNQSTHIWERWPQPLLLGKTLVIIGVGAIAEALAPRAKAFGMTVFGVSGSRRQPPAFDRIFARHEIESAAAQADFLVVIVPHSPETENLIDARVIASLRPSAFLINVARGGVLDEGALLAALRDKRIAGAALDVFRESPLPPAHPLWAEESIIITPHIGGMSNIYLEQAYPMVRDNIRAFLAGRSDEMLNLVIH
ncbi:MAG TPA: D-2-hydroxyacid dehydrogenase [Steroidobacteraceae bacterium]